MSALALAGLLLQTLGAPQSPVPTAPVTSLAVPLPVVPPPVVPPPVVPPPVVPPLAEGRPAQTAAAPTAPSALGAPDGRPLSLDQAVALALRNQPQIQQSRAAVEAANARADQSLSSLLPQVTGTASYQRATGNYVPRAGAVPSQLNAAASPATSFNTYDFFNFGITGSILVYDFGQTRGRWRAAQASVEVQQATEYATRMQVVLSVRAAYFQVRAQRALVSVARDTLANQDKHLAQIQGFVELGARPEIDLAQARSDRAIAEVQLINAQNAYDTARAQLSQAMGEDQPVVYEVSEDSLPPVRGEDGPVEALVDASVANRPDLLALRRQEEALRRTVTALKGAYGPSLSVSTGVTDAGRQLDNMAWNWNAQASLSWPIYQGGLTRAQVSEAEANVAAQQAQIRTLRQQIRFEVDQARLASRAAKATLVSAEVAVTNARERFRLAEGRYATGVGSIIELGDAQVALSTALGQRVQAEYSLATARAQLLKAIGQQ